MYKYSAIRTISLVFLLTAIIYSPGYAYVSSDISIKKEKDLELELQNQINIDVDQKSDISMSFYTDSFISSAYQETKQKDFSFFAAQLLTLPPQHDGAAFDIQGAVSPNNSLLNHIKISEIYYQSDSLIQNARLIVGRVKHGWSQLDESWNLGLWQPVYKWNALDRESMGLSGILLTSEQKYFKINLFASTIFLPDQGASFEIQEGSFVKANPWFKRPPDQMSYYNEVSSLEYDIIRPQEAEVINQKSYSAQIEFGSKKSGNFISLEYAQKPSNQLAVAYSAILDIPKDKGIVTLKPYTFNHSLIGIDSSVRVAKLNLGVSVVREKILEDNANLEGYTIPVISDSELVSPFIEYGSDKFKINISTLHVYGAEVSEKGPQADPTRNALFVRYPYRDASKLSLHYNYLFSKNKNLLSQVSLIRSFSNEFNLVQIKFDFKANSKLNFFADIQLIDALNNESIQTSEISQFINNDQVILGVRYAL